MIDIKGDLDWRYHPTRGLYLVWISPNGEIQPLVPDVTFEELEIIAQRTMMMLERIQMLMQPQAHIYLVNLEQAEPEEAKPVQRYTFPLCDLDRKHFSQFIDAFENEGEKGLYY